MSVFSEVVFYLCIVFCFSLAAYVPPKIIRESDIEYLIVNAGVNFNLTCQGSEPLEWIYPEATDGMDKWTTFHSIPSVVPHNNDYMFRSVLHITNISYPFVGYYMCQYEFLSTDKDQIYVYVNDTDHLSVEGGDEGKFNLHYVSQYEDTTIPCRPTTPDINVELVSYGADEKIDAIFDPKTGFTFTIKDISFEDTYTCDFTRPRDDKYFQSIYILKINPSRAYLATPYIEDLSRNHTEVGQMLNLTCFLQDDSNSIRFKWKTPRGHFHADDQNSKNVMVSKTYSNGIEGKKYLKSTLIIKESRLEDRGFYSCEVSDAQNNHERSELYVVVHDKIGCSIKINAQNHQDSIIVEAGESAQWILDIRAHPVAKLTWYDNNGKLILKNDNTYFINYTGDKAVLKVENASLENDGIYTVHGISQRERDTERCPQEIDFPLTLTVYDKPSVCIASEEVSCSDSKERAPSIYLIDEEVELECIARGNPLPVIAWEEKVCLGQECQFYEIAGQEKTFPSNFLTGNYLKINTLRDGTVKCIASNSLGNDESTRSYYISDVKNGFDVFDFGPDSIVDRSETNTELIVAENSTLTFTCAVHPRRSEILEIFLDNGILNEDGRHHIHTVGNNLSKKTTVSLNQAQLSDSGTYSCRIRNIHDNSYDYLNLTFIVKEPDKPIILESNLDENIHIDYPNMKYTLYCNISGIPKPTLEWYKENKLIVPSKRVTLKDENMVLHFNKTEVDDEGTYRCEASNSQGTVFKEAQLFFKVKPVSVAIYYYITGAIGLLLLAALIYIFIRIRKEKALRRELKLLGLENFHNGSPENLNPELGIDDQAELLPYNKKYEFPIEQLKIGKQLGSGAFGVVMKADARGIIEGEPKTTVAVKMVKKNADQSYIKALASELKIMVHLGKHINVVNLLGACTKNVAKRELLIIVEFCRFGNLQNYLYKHRASYINQVDPITGTIDYNIGADILERSYSVSSENGQVRPRSYSAQDYRNRRSTTSNTQFTSLAGDETVILSNNSIQPEWRLNYKGDYRGDVKPISTRDLITWSFQVARGMEYLASRKVLHGDLAARNILLADNNIVKICDFGLAKTMYNDNNYKKKGNNPLPVKWMAIESIRDRVFSTQSDVWSFGIVLWELFSLAKTPYPGMEADERLYYKLAEGYRMESPPYAPRDMYKIMLDCWNTKPLARPSFTTLAEVIGGHLEDSVRKHYVDLNNPYLRMNIEKSQDNDYLGMLSPPSFDVLSTPAPRYVNAEMFVPEIKPTGPEYLRSPEGYLFMGGNQVFSPRLENDDVFNFQTGSKRESSSGSQELRPMLYSNTESDNETGYLVPITPINSVSNPSYLEMSAIQSKKTPKANSEVVETPDNYISMPQCKNIVHSNHKNEQN